MKIRKDRTHKCGNSNIDYRTKKDLRAIEIFMPWNTKRDLGTMGYESYKLSYAESKKIIKVTESLNTQKNIFNEIPDPKYYSTAQFYRVNNIPFKEKAMFACDRVAQLDECCKGKQKFTGDSLMISDICKNRKLVREYGENVKQKNQNLDMNIQSIQEHFEGSNENKGKN